MTSELHAWLLREARIRRMARLAGQACAEAFLRAGNPIGVSASNIGAIIGMLAGRLRTRADGRPRQRSPNQ